MVSAIDVSDKLCETGLDIGAMNLIKTLIMYCIKEPCDDDAVE